MQISSRQVVDPVVARLHCPAPGPVRLGDVTGRRGRGGASPTDDQSRLSLSRAPDKGHRGCGAGPGSSPVLVYDNRESLRGVRLVGSDDHHEAQPLRWGLHCGLRGIRPVVCVNVRIHTPVSATVYRTGHQASVKETVNGTQSLTASQLVNSFHTTSTPRWRSR